MHGLENPKGGYRGQAVSGCQREKTLPHIPKGLNQLNPEVSKSLGLAQGISMESMKWIRKELREYSTGNFFFGTFWLVRREIFL